MNKRITKHAAECYEELLESIRKEGGRQFYDIIFDHMTKLAANLAPPASTVRIKEDGHRIR